MHICTKHPVQIHEGSIHSKPSSTQDGIRPSLMCIFQPLHQHRLASHPIDLFTRIHFQIRQHEKFRPSSYQLPGPAAHCPVLTRLPMKIARLGRCFAFENWHEIDAIHQVAAGCYRIGETGEGRQKIHRHDRGGIRSPCRNHIRPRSDTRHAMSPFEQAAFAAAQSRICLKSLGGRWSVVGTKYYQSMRFEMAPVQSCHHFTDRVIQRSNHFLVCFHSRSLFALITTLQRIVGSTLGEIQKERSIIRHDQNHIRLSRFISRQTRTDPRKNHGET